MTRYREPALESPYAYRRPVRCVRPVFSSQAGAGAAAAGPGRGRCAAWRRSRVAPNRETAVPSPAVRPARPSARQLDPCPTAAALRAQPSRGNPSCLLSGHPAAMSWQPEAHPAKLAGSAISFRAQACLSPAAEALSWQGEVARLGGRKICLAARRRWSLRRRQRRIFAEDWGSIGSGGPLPGGGVPKEQRRHFSCSFCAPLALCGFSSSAVAALGPGELNRLHVRGRLRKRSRDEWKENCARDSAQSASGHAAIPTLDAHRNGITTTRMPYDKQALPRLLCSLAKVVII